MGKDNGFLEFSRVEEEKVPVEQRIRNFDEFHLPLEPEARRQQAARCMNCGVPLCQSAVELGGMVTGCPLHNLIPEWNDEIWRGNEEQAVLRLLKRNNFPEFTGRVCPALCEKACINGLDSLPVTIRENEKYIIEQAFAAGRMQPHIPAVSSGRRVAIVGSGPSGLAAADQLRHRGHQVTVYEREDEIGGLLMYGIPNMKLEKNVILRRRALMEAEGVVFRTGVDVGKDISAKQLVAENDAVILCAGAKEPRVLQAAGMEKKPGGVFYAVDFLTRVTRHLRDAQTEDPTPMVKGRDVVILGGGDTGNDCAGSCVRLGAKSVTQLEMMPRPPVERTAQNPWPQWPKILKTDYGQEEAAGIWGADPRIYETTIKEVLTENGHITKVRTAAVRFQDRKMELVKGSEKLLPCGLLLIAAGFTGCQPYTPKAFGVGLTSRGMVDTGAGGFATGVDKVFAAGDMHRGQSLVVWAIAEGRACAEEVDAYLMGYTELSSPL